MKFAALALALLLTVGSQAAVLQADAPSDLEHHFAAFQMGINGLKNSLAPLEGTEYSHIKDWMQWMLERLDERVMTGKENIVSFIEAVKESTAGSVELDIERIRQELTPLWNELRIREHINQYIEKLGPILNQITKEYHTAADAVVPKIEPDIMELRNLFRVNVMHTKEKLVPILQVLHREMTALYSKVKGMADGYVQDYREHMDLAMRRLQSLTPDQITKRREEINSVALNIMGEFSKLQEIAFREES